MREPGYEKPLVLRYSQMLTLGGLVFALLPGGMLVGAIVSFVRGEFVLNGVCCKSGAEGGGGRAGSFGFCRNFSGWRKAVTGTSGDAQATTGTQASGASHRFSRRTGSPRWDRARGCAEGGSGL